MLFVVCCTSIFNLQSSASIFNLVLRFVAVVVVVFHRSIVVGNLKFYRPIQMSCSESDSTKLDSRIQMWQQFTIQRAAVLL
jgi:hypothetical protein